MAAGASHSVSAGFQWGERVKDSEHSYERMCLNGVWYSLFDCVGVRSHAEKPHVAKLMRLFEEDGVRKVRMRWFLKRFELPVTVAREASGKNEKEIFIAQGGVKGVENVNLVETIVGKVNVLCTARCPRNPQPSQQQVDDADYFFGKVYDAKNQKLVKMEQFERTEKSLASKFFNKSEWLLTPLAGKATYEDLGSPTSVTDFEMVDAKKRLSKPGGSHGLQETEYKKLKILQGGL